jgi:acyl-CoA dehydrogenase
MSAPTNKPGPTESSSGRMKELVHKAKCIASEVVRPAAASVDREGRFPREAIAALQEARLLSCAIPVELGGAGCSMGDMAAICTALGRACGSAGMIFAMHQMQVGCIARHYGASSFFADYLREAARRQLLLASGTSEVGVGGDLRTSIAGIEAEETDFKLHKCCTTVSYGEYADAILITARRSNTAASGDQSLALIRKEDYALEKTGAWDVMGMRGTCSPPFNVTARAPLEQIVPEPFRDIAIQTMIPYSHILWSAVWLGIAADAVAITQSLIKQTARKSPKVMPLGSPGLVEALNLFHQMSANVSAAVAEYERCTADPAAAATLSTSAYGLRINNLKLSSTKLAVDICLQCLAVCGLAGYANNSPFSLGRQLRDALSGQLMISNNRLRQTNAGLLLVTGTEVLEEF